MTACPPTRQHLIDIFRAAVEAVAPERLVASHLARDGSATVVLSSSGAVTRFDGVPLVLAVGKASVRMAAAVRDLYGDERLRGLVVAADGTSDDCGLPVRESGHPVPDERGERASREVANLLRSAPETTVLVLLSGGASSLLPAPRPPVTLQDKIAVTRLLLAAGADIGELNTVRKHLSVLKGGGLLRLAQPRKVVALILSDVIGDDPAAIGSGPTAADPSTFADAARVLCRYDLGNHLPQSVKTLFKDGVAGRIDETAGTEECRKFDVTNLVIGSNAVALGGAADRALELGYQVIVEERPLEGDTTATAREWSDEVVQNLGPGHCAIAGGETTVRVRGRGRGGRNQEFALALAPAIHGSGTCVLSAGTDGIDGPTDAAGAFVDGTTVDRARAAGVDWVAALADNDSHGFFGRLADLFRCGPTGTNVCDVKIALRPK